MIRFTGIVERSLAPPVNRSGSSQAASAYTPLAPGSMGHRPSAASVSGSSGSIPSAPPSVRKSWSSIDQTSVAHAAQLPESPGEEVINDTEAPILKQSKPFYEVASEVRKTNRAGFAAKRAELKHTVKNFDKNYDIYRRWRDCPEDDPNIKKIRGEGMAAQKYVMRHGNLDSEKAKLYDLLSEKPELLKYISPINGDFRAPRIGVVAGLRETNADGEKVPTLTFPGTGAGAMIRSQMRLNVQQVLRKDGPPEAYTLGVKLAEAIREGLKKKDPDTPNLVLTGHSLGGGIASYVGAWTADPRQNFAPQCYLYNPAAMGGGSLRALNKKVGDNLAQCTANHVVIRVKYDQVSSSAMQKRLASVVSFLKRTVIDVPRHVGKVYTVARKLLDKSHQDLLSLHRLECFKDIYDQVTVPQNNPAKGATV